MHIRNLLKQKIVRHVNYLELENDENQCISNLQKNLLELLIVESNQEISSNNMVAIFNQEMAKIVMHHALIITNVQMTSDFWL